MSYQQNPPVESLSQSEWASLSANAQAVVIGLVEENQQLKLMVSKLQEQFRRNSRNSSHPPLQDTPEPKASQEAETRQPRQRGGQAGHAGRGRALIPVEAVDHLVVHRPEQCRECGALLLGYDPAPHRHQITELPPLKATVTEHQVHT